MSVGSSSRGGTRVDSSVFSSFKKNWRTVCEKLQTLEMVEPRENHTDERNRAIQARVLDLYHSIPSEQKYDSYSAGQEGPYLYAHRIILRLWSLETMFLLQNAIDKTRREIDPESQLLQVSLAMFGTGKPDEWKIH